MSVPIPDAKGNALFMLVVWHIAKCRGERNRALVSRHCFHCFSGASQLFPGVDRQLTSTSISIAPPSSSRWTSMKVIRRERPIVICPHSAMLYGYSSHVHRGPAAATSSRRQRR